MKILSAEEMRATDERTTRDFGVSMSTLMEKAGAAVATFVQSQFPQARRITVICGTGNNGGDGFVAARLLAQRGLAVAVLLLGDESKLRGDAADMYTLLDGAGVAAFRLIHESELSGLDALLSGSDLLVDAFVGTGFKPPLRGVAVQVRDRIEQVKVPVLAVDLPSGWDPDSRLEKFEGAFRADAVVTFTAPKAAHVFGHLTPSVFGPVVVAPIGSPDDALVSEGKLLWTGSSKRLTGVPRPINSNKGRFGHVLVVGGSTGKSGAPAMTSFAALRSGAGLVTAAVPKSALSSVAAITPELMTSSLAQDDDGNLARAATDQVATLLAKKINVLALGPGLGTEGETSSIVREIVAASKVANVIDADGLNAFKGQTHLLDGRDRPLVLTPHPGEMATLLGVTVKDVEADREHIARDFATRHSVTLVLKGWRTLVAHPDGTIAVNTSANPSMAKGGSGDILTGIVAAMIAQHPGDIADAVSAAVYLHGLAADFAAHRMDEHCVLATDTVAHLSDAFRYRSVDANGFTWLTGLRA